MATWEIDDQQILIYYGTDGGVTPLFIIGGLNLAGITVNDEIIEIDGITSAAMITKL